VNEHGTWVYQNSEEFEWLIHSVDRRAAADRDASFFIGTWLEDLRGKVGHSLGDLIFCPQYNVEKHKIADTFAGIGLKVDPNFATKFIPIFLNIKKYLQTHEFLLNDFNKKNGYRLEALASILWFISNMFYLAGIRYIKDGRTMLGVLEHGYRVLELGLIHDSCDNLIEDIHRFFPSIELSQEEV
jgi:hypothetical protein